MGHADEERRQYVRVGLSTLVSYTVIAMPEKHKESVSGDISGGGMRLPLKEELSTDTVLELKLELLKKKKNILLKAVVVWVRPRINDKEYPYEVGIEFLNIGLAERTMLSNCIQYLNRKDLLKEFWR